MEYALTIIEQDRLQQCEAVIERGLKTFTDVGNALLEIRDSRLYRAEFHTFEDYCRERWNIQRAHAYRMIDAAGVVKNLSPIGDILPATESQARPLTRLGPEEQRQAWQMVIDQAPPTGITAALVLEAAKKIQAVRREERRVEILDRLQEIESRAVNEPDGLYDVIVIDPPWPMVKIERDVAPNQVEFEYPTMTIDEIKKMQLPMADDCHLWLWTTHKFLPDALEILRAWGVKYVCSFVWHKPGGFQPFGLPQYNCEFALYARRGSPIFADVKDFKVCFDAPRGAHSEKPEWFYDLVRRVTVGRRLDMFNRRPIDGFDGWGNEAC